MFMFKNDLSHYNSVVGQTQDSSSRVEAAIDGKLVSNSNRVKHIMSKSTKTPLQVIQNPILAHSFGDHNNSNRDDFSDLSDDDLYFLDEYLINTPFQMRDAETSNMGFNKVADPNSNKVITEGTPKTSDVLYEFVGEKVRISKSASKPCGDSCFVSTFGMGIADGVGGWASYGIDPSKFSHDLMDHCRAIVDAKSDHIIQGYVQDYTNDYNKLRHQGTSYDRKSKNQEFEIHQGDDSSVSGHTCSSRDHKEHEHMVHAFGVKFSKRPLKRTRSSFHLDANNLNQYNGETSPRSDSSRHEKAIKAKNTKIDPRVIMRDGYKRVSEVGSSTALI